MKGHLDWHLGQDHSLVVAEYDRQNKEIIQILDQRFRLVIVAVLGTVAILGWFAGVSGHMSDQLNLNRLADI